MQETNYSVNCSQVDIDPKFKDFIMLTVELFDKQQACEILDKALRKK